MPLSNPKAFFDSIRPALFHRFLSKDQVGGINALLAAWDGQARDLVAYGLATPWWETDFTMQPVAEIGHGKHYAYGRPDGPYGQIYYGRGYVQTTWFRNYDRMDKELHEDGTLKSGESLVKTPDLALRPDVAAKGLVRGMTEGWYGPRVGQFITRSSTDFVNARRSVNVLDHALDIAHAAEHFRDALIAGGYAGVVS